MKTLLALLTIKAVLMALYIYFGGLPLGPDEAQYWTWSQELDVGYYSKPPGIAWVIFLGTSLFGSTELGVRAFCLLLTFALPLAVVFLAKGARLESNERLLAAYLMALTPLGIFSSLLATTDGMMVLFWTLAVAAFLLDRPYLFGGMVACGALFKWPIYFLLFLPLVRIKRKAWLVGMAIALLGLIPPLYWNWTHDFATFRHVGHAMEEAVSRGNPLEFLGAQFALASPIIFILLIASYFKLFQAQKEVRFLGGFSLLILLCYFSLSFFKKMQGNWCVFLYPMAFVYLAAMGSKRWQVVGLGLSVVLCLIVLLCPLPYKISPFRHNLGNDRLKTALRHVGYDPLKDALISDTYQTTSLISFYSEGQKRAYFLNLHGARQNQFSFWTGLETGAGGIFVTASKGEVLSEYFTSVVALEDIELYPGKSVRFFRCRDYNGKAPDGTPSW